MKAPALLILAALCSLSSAVQAASANDFGPVSMGSFYTSLPPLPDNAPVGKLLKAEKIHVSLAGVNAWKIVYVSSDLEGRKTRVTGIVAAPAGSSTAPRPVVAWAHGTTGTAQNCGPSQVLEPAQPLNQYFSPTGNSWTDFGLPGMEAFIKAGYVIVATDYQGQGGGGRHQYTVAATQARDVIDSIRAVTQLDGAQAGSRAIVYGWSQGGGAVIAAAGLGDYLHDKTAVNSSIELLGFVAMAPYDVAVAMPPGAVTNASAKRYLDTLNTSFSSNIFNFTHYAQNVWGTAAAFPDLHLSDIFTEEGAAVLDGIFLRKCMHVSSDTISYVYGKNYKTLLRSDIRNPMDWVKAYIKGSVAPVKPMAPVIIYFGDKDVTVPPVMGRIYQKQMCKLGGNVTRVQLSGHPDHFGTPPAAEPLYVQWVADRFAGKAAENGCF